MYAIPVLTPFREKKHATSYIRRRFKNQDGEVFHSKSCQDQHGVFDGCIRRLPIECEKLQGMPPDWTKTGASGKEISDSTEIQTVATPYQPVVKHILERMLKNDES